MTTARATIINSELCGELMRRATRARELLRLAHTSWVFNAANRQKIDNALSELHVLLTPDVVLAMVAALQDHSDDR